VWGRSSFRLADVAYTFSAARRGVEPFLLPELRGASA
jgi:hypothetical protein